MNYYKMTFALIFIYLVSICIAVGSTDIELSTKLIGGSIFFALGSIAIGYFVKSNIKNMDDFLRSPNSQSFKNIMYRKKAD
ncbi:hypothetical protein SAMN05216600_102441 [Pseudomonas cuatrocienegasensis]|uniref:Uncharacterized protein n=1 Tax=Pseudomonas cuatrocienegasensis TaxID=543360 RepID=A0ABY1B5U9_9PSED|nr:MULTISPECIES: hypothetical protein [Pseudomonas]OEC37451.1 hypothetical protein A7D25_01950 [Pseudomonas sp. 21C1]SEP97228.1 hypothetical protein SAMN05216600_102441 [Pseudomonas cuatrocienegasensis]